MAIQLFSLMFYVNPVVRLVVKTTRINKKYNQI